MCYRIIHGGVDIETPRQFRDHFGFDPTTDPSYGDVMPDACLCQVNVEEDFKRLGIPFVQDCGDYVVPESFIASLIVQ